MTLQHVVSVYCGMYDTGLFFYANVIENAVNTLIFKAISLISERAEISLHMQNGYTCRTKHVHTLMMVCASLVFQLRLVCVLKMHI